MISGTRYRLTAEIGRQARLAQDIARGQMEISGGKRILAPSDDPAASARVAELRRTQANQTVWKANADAAASLASQVDITLTSLGTAMTRARELMLSASSDTLNDSDRHAIAVELRGIVEDIQSYAAEKDSRGYPLFPADDQALLIPIGPGVRVAATTTSGAVFQNVDTPGGPADLAQIVSDAADAIELTDTSARQAATAAALAAVEAGDSHVSSVRGEHGVRAARIDAVRERLEAGSLQIEEERSGLEDTDISRVVAQINAKQLTLEAAQAAFARINRNTLFDLLG
jgi:flagellar hook-associated protein 3 FlgL